MKISFIKNHITLFLLLCAFFSNAQSSNDTIVKTRKLIQQKDSVLVRCYFVDCEKFRAIIPFDEGSYPKISKYIDAEVNFADNYIEYEDALVNRIPEYCEFRTELYVYGVFDNGTFKIVHIIKSGNCVLR